MKTSILHLLTAAKNASPFDVNMAYDSGFEKIMPYTNVILDEVLGLTQDVIFSRSPSGIKQTGVFIGGRDIDLAMDMLNASRKAMFEPFACSIFADPSGAFTTAAAMIAKVEASLKQQFNESLEGQKIAVFGATGPVGGCVGIIAAKHGADVTLVAHSENSYQAAQAKANNWQKTYDVKLAVALGSDDAQKQNILSEVNVVLSAAAAGVQVISKVLLAKAQALKVVADVNAVAPTGIEGVEVNHDGIQLENRDVFGIGALAVGQLKYGTQIALLQSMLEEKTPQVLDFMSAFSSARLILANADAVGDK